MENKGFRLKKTIRKEKKKRKFIKLDYKKLQFKENRQTTCPFLFISDPFIVKPGILTLNLAKLFRGYKEGLLGTLCQSYQLEEIQLSSPDEKDFTICFYIKDNNEENDLRPIELVKLKNTPFADVILPKDIRDKSNLMKVTKPLTEIDDLLLEMQIEGEIGEEIQLYISFKGFYYCSELVYKGNVVTENDEVKQYIEEKTEIQVKKEEKRVQKAKINPEQDTLSNWTFERWNYCGSCFPNMMVGDYMERYLSKYTPKELGGTASELPHYRRGNKNQNKKR